MITIKNKQNGFTRTLGEPEFNGMIDKADYDIVTAKEPAKEPAKKTANSGPDDSWTKSDLKEYMDENSISYNSGDTKQDLLAKIGT